ncbi:MAG: cupin domain-containing protein [Angelakisella sp.]
MMEVRLKEIAERIRTLREILELSEEHMAAACGITPEQYREKEAGSEDFSFSFLLQCAEAMGVDMVELITGETPKLTGYSIVRSGQGLPIQRRKGFKYNHLAYLFKDKKCEPFIVVAPYSEEAQQAPIELSRHPGQEFDLVLSGSLKMMFEEREELLREGDSVYYNSSCGHGMIATGGKDCTFLAVVLKDGAEGSPADNPAWK